MKLTLILLFVTSFAFGQQIIVVNPGDTIILVGKKASEPQQPQQPVDAKITYSIVNGAVKIDGVDGTNSVIVDNDWWNDTPEDDLLNYLHNKKLVKLVGNIFTHNPDPNYPNEKSIPFAHRDFVPLSDTPPLIMGALKPLVRPANKNIDSTVPESGPGVDLIIAEAKKATPQKPLVVFVGGQATSVASAYLKDKSIADRVVVLHLAGYWSKPEQAQTYNTADWWSAYIAMKRMKYLSIGFKWAGTIPHNYSHHGHNVGLTQAMIDVLPASTTNNAIKKWYREKFAVEYLADAYTVLWFLNNSLWRKIDRKMENGSIVTHDNYDFIAVAEQNWAGYGPELINQLRRGSTTGQIPPTEQPQIPGGGTIVNPSQNLKSAVENAKGAVLLAKGNFNFPSKINVPVGVTLKGESGTILRCTGCKEGPMLALESSSRVDGNQSISNIVFEGANDTYSAIHVRNRDNVTIDNISVLNTTFTGVWVNETNSTKILNSDFYNAAWSGENYLSGAVNLRNVKNGLIQGNKFRSDKNSKGTGIEALWKYPDNPNVLENLKILNNEFRLSHHNPWNKGASQNFSIEFHNTDYKGIEIAYNYFGNELSLASHRPATGAKTLVHHNTGDLGGDFFFIEAVCDDLEVYDNNITNVKIFSYNVQPNGVWKNHVYRNNTITNPSPPIHWGSAWFIIGHDGVQNYVIENNKFPNDRKTVQYQRVQGGVTLK